MRIETIAELVARIEALFSGIGLVPEQMSGMAEHGVMFMVPGKAKAVMERLQAETGPDGWDYEGGYADYRNEAENWGMGISSVPGMALCMASVSSLHAAHLDQFRGPSPAERDAQMARDRIRAEQGDARAAHAVGDYYYEYHPRDYEAAFHWYRKAAGQGLAEAQARLAWMYRDGLGVAQDHAEAAAWRRKAAEQGDAASQFLLGAMYEDGVGVAQDYAEAELWYRRLADQGSREGARAFRSLRRKVKRLEREAKARQASGRSI